MTTEAENVAWMRSFQMMKSASTMTLFDILYGLIDKTSLQISLRKTTPRMKKNA
jgi:hypothetical protein